MTGLAPVFRLPPGVPSPASPIGSRDELLGFFRAGEKGGSPAPVQLVGVELEKVPLLGDASAAPFEGERSVTSLLESLAGDDFELVEADGHVLGMTSAGSQIHLEPGAQVELALPPRGTGLEILADLRNWQEMLRRAAKATGVHAVALGLQPLTPVDEIGWIPKERYRIMREHLCARGKLAAHMMKATAGTQYNLDYQDEDDAATLFRASLSASPIVNALCANSPLEGGRPNGFMTKRPHVWLHTDPDRCGILPWIDDDGFSYEGYVAWALGIPLMFVIRDGSWVQVGDRTFGELLEREDARVGPPRHEDWALHLTTLFPEVRIKQHLEIRGTDSCSPELAAGVAALWRGLLYDGRARAEILNRAADLTSTERLRLHEDAGRLGLHATFAGRSLASLALDLIDLGAAGLERLDGPGGTDAPLLDPLREMAARGETAADVLLREWPARGPAAILPG